MSLLFFFNPQDQGLAGPGSPGFNTVLSLTRLNLGDQGTSFTTQVVGDGVTMVFDIPYELIEASTTSLNVSITGLTGTTFLGQAAGPPSTGQYSIAAQQGLITIWRSLAQTETLIVSGIYYNKYLTSDLTTLINAAFAQHTYLRSAPGPPPPLQFDSNGNPIPPVVPAYTFDTLPSVELYPLSLLATMEAMWGEIAEAANEVDVETPEGMHIPAGQRFQQILQAIQVLETQYKDLSAQLNIGLWRVQVLDLRRVSRTTGRLVPLYRSMEWDDTNPPTRLYPPIEP